MLALQHKQIHQLIAAAVHALGCCIIIGIINCTIYIIVNSFPLLVPGRRELAGMRTVLGQTTESLELTHCRDFVGLPGSRTPNAQPFHVAVHPLVRAPAACPRQELEKSSIFLLILSLLINVLRFGDVGQSKRIMPEQVRVSWLAWQMLLSAMALALSHADELQCLLERCTALLLEAKRGDGAAHFDCTVLYILSGSIVVYQTADIIVDSKCRSNHFIVPSQGTAPACGYDLVHYIP